MMKLSWHSNVRITVRSVTGQVLDVREYHNLIVNVGLNMLRDVLAGDVSDGEIKYIALGSDNTPPAVTDTLLGTETFRKAVTSSSKPAVGQWKSVYYIAPAEAGGVIEEMGWFAGAAAGGGADTGILVARVLYSRVKTKLESINVERLDRFEEG